MFKKIVLIFSIVFFMAAASNGGELVGGLYPVEPPSESRQIEQIKWAHNQGYVYGILASYGWFHPITNQQNFTLPIINTAWEVGYVKGVIEVYDFEKEGK